ncbi:MAG: trypsin-like serine protease [Pseudomonadota bacterium]
MIRFSATLLAAFGLAGAAMADPPAFCFEEGELTESSQDSLTDRARDTVGGWVDRLSSLSSTGEKVVNGRRVCPGDWPYSAAIRRPEADVVGYYCGGTVISDEWVLTAAHCVAGSRRSARGFYVEPGLGEIEVVLGTNDLSDESRAKTFKVREVKMHPDYVPYNQVTGEAELNDIALIRLAEKWDGPVSRLSSSPRSDADRAGGRAFVSGFGLQEEVAGTDDGRRVFPRSGGGSNGLAGSQYLLQAVLPMVAPSVCRSQYGTYDPRSKICAGFAVGGKDSCQGDSGGPLVTIDANAIPYQIGVVSYGYGCARKDSYAVYTRISAYRDWIERYVSDAQFVNPEPETNRELVLSVHDRFMDYMRPATDRMTLNMLTGPNFVDGQLLRFEITPSTKGKLLVLDINARGEITQLYPNQFSAGTGLLEAGETVEIPNPLRQNFVLPAKADPAGEGRLIAFVVPEDVTLPAGYEPDVDNGLQTKTESSTFAMNLIHLLETEALEESQSDMAKVKPGWAFASQVYTISQ